jgi:hypothetical protein
MRIFILGTGYSLRSVDLDLLKGEFSIACNRIHLLYDKFEWRPSVYIYEDPKGNPYREADMLLHLKNGYPCWFATDTLQWVSDWWDWKNLRVFHRCEHSVDSPSTYWHLPHLCAQGGPVNTACQLAVREYGATEIVLLGCDGHYEKGRDNHLADDYAPKMMNRSAAKTLNRTMQFSHTQIEYECALHCVTVHNATRGTKIDAHRKTMLEDLL